MADIKDKWPWPASIGNIGMYPEEMKALRKVEKNPDASPMPELAPTKLLTPLQSSDNLRMGEPALPAALAEATSIPLTHVVFRRVLAKARRKGAVLFEEAVEKEDLADLPADRRQQMRTMLARERAMLELLDHYNGLAEDVYMRLIATAKG
jgi:hypothetical protein